MQKELQAAKRKLENKLSKLEADIANHENKLEELQAEMLKPEIASNSVQLQDICKKADEIKQNLDLLYEEWEQTGAELEAYE